MKTKKYLNFLQGQWSGYSTDKLPRKRKAYERANQPGRVSPLSIQACLRNQPQTPPPLSLKFLPLNAGEINLFQPAVKAADNYLRAAVG